MFVYDKKLQYPVKIATPNPRLAAIIISQYGGPGGELGASLRYLSQRYAMPFDELKGLLTDIGTEASKLFRALVRLCIRNRFPNCESQPEREQMEVNADMFAVLNHHFI